MGVLALLATCGLFSLLLVQDELAGRDPQRNPDATGPPPRDISSRTVDPEPLTVDEVFPTERIVINASEGPYRLLGTHDSKNCTVAAADELADLIDSLDCSQVIRGTLRSPNRDYLITTGVFNLATADEAGLAYEAIDPVIENQTGRLLGLLAGEDTDAIVLAQTQTGWDYRGHFLIYAVIARADSAAFTAADDRFAELIIWDMVEVHLRSGVLERRATASVSASEPADPAA